MIGSPPEGDRPGGIKVMQLDRIGIVQAQGGIERRSHRSRSLCKAGEGEQCIEGVLLFRLLVISSTTIIALGF